ncbi:hypothetical protein [Nocardioides lijunqiniae]|uniref:hypothetical protein n=1 Tax=Nocardioides lijunqiniae TaxID=2760832 RepID=UPI001D0CA282|nr:hypothetical protein [Nocardioides lijunqiniae]
MAEPTMKSQAWGLFDQVVAEAPLRGVNPWVVVNNNLEFRPDYSTLERLLGVPVFLGALSQSGVPALAVDVWTAYELRRAGFHPDRVWPRAEAPRVLPPDVAALVESLPRDLRSAVQQRLDKGFSGGTASASANLLGKNYVKQVDVVMSTWQTGPELMISTKRMDSSFGKNAANRVEESYGDAKNLSLRHPQAALGFMYSLRSTAFTEESDTAAWLLDLLAKLGREDDAYDAVGLIVPEWNSPVPPGDDAGALEDAAPIDIDLAIPSDSAAQQVPRVQISVNSLPQVTLRHDLIPSELAPGRFFELMTTTVLMNTPINMHRDARALRARPLPVEPTVTLAVDEV